MSSLLGVFGRLYYNNKWYASDQDYYVTPQWVEINLARDVELSGSLSEFTITPRGSLGYAATVVSLIDMTVDAGVLHVRTTDQYYAQLQKLLNSWLARAPFELAVMEDDITAQSSSGLRLAVQISNARKGELIGSEQTWDFTFRQTLYPDGNVPVLYQPNP